MLFFVLFLVGFYTQIAQGQALPIPDFACGYGLYPQEVTGQIHGQAPSFYRSGTIRPVLLFGKFKDSNDPVHLDSLQSRAGILSSTDILNPGRVGSLAHYFKEMSNGALSLAAPPGVAGRWFESNRTDLASYGINSRADCASKRYTALRDFSEEVIAAADGFIDFSAYDGDDALGVDLVSLVIPQEFGETCGFHGTIFDISYMTQDAVEVRTVIASDTRRSVVGVLAHEYGHAMGLPELLDYEAQNFMEQSAGIGSWGVMGLGPLGWPEGESWPPNFTVGPHPYSAWSRAYVGWSPPEKVEADTTGLQIYDVHDAAGKVYQIPVLGSDTEYFLLANRQNTYSESTIGNYYDDYAPKSGLLIWHIDESPMVPNSNVVNAYEEHKHVDLECADGLFADRGFPSNTPDSERGGDNLDYLSSDSTYTADHNGNFGDAGDVWISGEFTPSSNPSTDGYSNDDTPDDYTDDRQAEFSGIAVRNITQNTNGSVSVDIHFIPSAPRDLGVAANGDQTQVTLAWSEPMVNATAITEYQYSIDETNWPSVDGGADARFVSFDNSTSTTFWVRAVTANEKGETAQVILDRPGTVGLEPSAALTTSPTVGDMLTATLSDPNVSNWTGVAVSWQWQRGDASSDSWTDIDGTQSIGTNTNRYTLTADDVDHQVRATANYDDEAGPNTDRAESDATAAVVAANIPPVLGGAPMVSLFFAENATSAVDTLTAYDADGDTLVWSLAGADSSAFRLAWLDTSRRALHFKRPPNYEALAGSFGNVYALWVIVRDAGTPSLADSVSVAVTIQDADDPGVVALSSLTPQVGDELKATLTDEDVPLENLNWHWSYFHASEVSGLNGSDVAERSRTLSVSTVHLGSRLLARVSYADRHGDQSAHSDTTAAVVGPPWKPQLTAAEPGAGQVVLRWTAPVRTGGSPLVGYESWHSGEGGMAWRSVAGGASADSVTVGGLTNGQEYTLAVRAVNQQFGAGAADSTQATPQAVNHAPVIAGPDSVSFAENDLSAVATYTATDADDDEITWSKGGADASSFTVGAQSGVLAFAHPPNYEQPADANGDSVYVVEVIATDDGTPSLADTLTVAVQVTDADDPGRLVLSSLTPQVWEDLTATLTDEDVPLENPNWDWSLFHAPEASGLNGPDVAERSQTLSVSTVHLGSRLLARVSYADRHGEQRAHSDTTAAVVGPPWKPQGLTATPGDRQVGLRWSAPVRTGGSPIVRYESWYSGEGGMTWSPVAGGASADSVTVGGLTNGQEYTLGVRAVNQQFGAGAADSTQATPQATNHAPVIAGPDSVSFAENDSSAVATYTATDADDDGITWSKAGADASSFTLGTQSGVLAFAHPPNYEQPADANSDRVYVVAVIATDDGTPSLADTLTVAVQVTDTDEKGTVDLSTMQPQVDQPITLTLRDEDGPLSGVSFKYFGIYRPGGATATATDSVEVFSANGADPDTVFTPGADWVGFQLKFWANYTDRHKAQTAWSKWTEPVFQPAVEDTGSVRLAPSSPRVREPVTATLTDADESITGACWTWQRRTSATAAWVDLPSPCAEGFGEGEGTSYPEVSSYTPQDADTGYQLRATVRYQDGHDTNHDTAASPATAAVQANVPTAPQHLTATAQSATEVHLTWDAPSSDGGATIDGYKYRFKKTEGGHWTPADSTTTRRQTLSVLTGHTLYTFEVWAENDQGAGAAAQDTVTTPKGATDTKGSVRLSTTRPQVGVELTATLTDPDHPTNTRWSWLYFSAGATEGTEMATEGAAMDSTLTPSGVLVGVRLQAQVLYDDDFGSNKSIPSTKTDPVLPRDCSAPRELKSPAQSTGSIDLTWQAPSPNCHPTGYEYRYKAEGGEWSPWKSAGSSRQTVSGLSEDTGYTLAVRAVNDAGNGTAAQLNERTRRSNTPGTVGLTPSTPQAGKQVTATLTDPDDPITGVGWSWTFFPPSAGGTEETIADSSDATGAGMDTRVINIPSDKADWRLQVTANYTDRDGTQTAQSDKSGPITAPDPPPDTKGSVGLSTTTPQVGQTITATLSDPDGPTNVRWSWLYFSAGATEGTAVDSSAVSVANGTTPTSTFTPSSVLVGIRLQAQALYDDDFGSNKSIPSTKTDPVLPRECSAPRNLTATAQSTSSIGLTWNAPSPNCQPTGYQYRYQAEGGSWSSWTSAGSSSQTVSGLSEDTSYTFAVRATNGGGNGTAAQASARTLKSNTKGSLSLSPLTPKACGSLTATLTDPDVPLSNDEWSLTHVYATEGGEDSLGVERSLAELIAEGLIEREEVEGLNGTNLYQRFTVAGWQADARLRVRVTYDDGLAADQTDSTLSNPVKPDKPKAPQDLESEQVGLGYSAIELTWAAPSSTCGRSLVRYEYRQQKQGGQWSSWSSVGLTTSYTASGLDSGSGYTFEVRAVNSVGAGPSASTSEATRASDETEGESPPGEGESPEEGETPPGEGESPSEEGEPPPDEGESLAGEGEPPSDEGETPPEEDEPPASAKPVLTSLLSTAPDSVLAAVSVPNPFNPSTTLHVQLPSSGPVSLTLYNLTGQVVRRLMEGYLDAGVYAYEWDGRDAQGQPVGSGVYVYRLRAGDQTVVGKVTLIR